MLSRWKQKVRIELNWVDLTTICVSALESVIIRLREEVNEDLEGDKIDSSSPRLDKGDAIRALYALDNKETRCLVSLFSILSDYNRYSKKWTPLYYNTFGLADEVRSVLDSKCLIFAQELRALLSKPHLQALMWVCDEIANERYKPLVPEENEQSSWTTSTNDFFDETSSVKIVQVIKNQEPLGKCYSLLSIVSNILLLCLLPIGATVKFDDVSGDVIFSRVMYGGAAYRSGLISTGDIIQEVNSFPLKGRSFQEIINILEHEARAPEIYFKLIPGDSPLSGSCDDSRIWVKALFDYNPQEDPFHPCPEAGISFRKGDILHIVCLDENWWQAKHEASSIDDDCFDSFHYISPRAGLIPSRQLQEKRIAALRDSTSSKSVGKFRTYKNHQSYKDKLKRGFKYRKVKKMMYRVKDADELDREDIPTYLDVILMKPKNGEYRPLVIVAPHPIDSNLIIEMLVALEPSHFGRPIPHTTREPKNWEVDGIDYHFTQREWFIEEMKNFRLVEYGQYNNNYYGIHIASIQAVIASGRVCLLNSNPKALKILYTPSIKPYIVFLRPSFHTLFHNPSNFIPLCINSEKIPVKAGDLKQMALASVKLEYLYSHYFDRILVVEDQDQLLYSLIDTIKMLSIEEQWVPADWITY